MSSRRYSLVLPYSPDPTRASTDRVGKGGCYLGPSGLFDGERMANSDRRLGRSRMFKRLAFLDDDATVIDLRERLAPYGNTEPTPGWPRERSVRNAREPRAPRMLEPLPLERLQDDWWQHVGSPVLTTTSRNRPGRWAVVWVDDGR